MALRLDNVQKIFAIVFVRFAIVSMFPELRYSILQSQHISNHVFFYHVALDFFLDSSENSLTAMVAVLPDFFNARQS